MTKLLVIILALGALSACKIADEVSPERFNPALCTEKSSEGCNVDWLFSFNRDNYPQNMQIILNDKVLIDDCDVSSQWSKTVGQRIDYRLTDYIDFKCDKTFKLKIRSAPTCNSSFKDHSVFEEQTCVRKFFHGTSEIWIEKN